MIDSYFQGEKYQGSFIVQYEKVNENCHYFLKKEYAGFGGFGTWMCEDSWWAGLNYYKGQCKGRYRASIGSKTNIHVQDDSLQWKYVANGSNVDLKFKCVDVSPFKNEYV